MTNKETNKPKRRKQPKAKREPRLDRIEVRLSTYEKFVVAAKAEALGITPSELLRVAAVGNVGLRRDPDIALRLADLKPVFRDLDGLVTNVNQIAHALNAEIAAGGSPEAARAAASLSSILGAFLDVDLRIRDSLVASYSAS